MKNIPKDNSVLMTSLPCGSLLCGKSYVYKIEKVLGQGTFGITYLATTRIKLSGALGEIETELKVAVKESFMKDINGRSDSMVTCSSSGDLYVDYRRKFAREATNLSQLKHPHIVRVLELFETNNTCYYSMEYCEGVSLDTLIEKQQGLDEQKALTYFRQISDAVSFMHENHMLHLDLKPLNIMLRRNGEAVLIDYGLSKQYTASGEPESSTRVGSGTPGYAPLEQANYREGKDFPVTMDVYALGATLFKMLSGIRPPEASEILNEGFPAYELQQKGVSDEFFLYLKSDVSHEKEPLPVSSCIPAIVACFFFFPKALCRRDRISVEVTQTAGCLAACSPFSQCLKRKESYSEYQRS